MSMTDKELAALIKEHEVMVTRVCSRILGDFDDVDEAKQRTWIALWNYYHTFDPERSSLQSWIRTIARNKAIQVYREGKEFLPIELYGDELESPYETPDQAYEAQELEDTLMERMAECLTPRQFNCLFLHAFSRLNTKEIGESLGISENAVHQTIHRARKRLIDREAA